MTGKEVDDVLVVASVVLVVALTVVLLVLVLIG